MLLILIHWKYNQRYQVVATGQINFIPKTQVVVPVYNKMAYIMPHSQNLAEIEKIFWLLRKNFRKQKK